MAVGHAFVPVHAMSQLAARVQSIDALHAVDPHSTRQGTPAGQVTLLVQLLVAVQSTTQMAPEHVPIVQAARQAATAAESAIAESRTDAPPEPFDGPSRSEAPPEPAVDPSNDDAPPEPAADPSNDDAPPEPVVPDESRAPASVMPPLAPVASAPPAVDEAPAPSFPPVPASPVEPAGKRS